MKTDNFKSDSKFLFLGGMFFSEQEKEVFSNSKSLPQTAANKFQWNLIKGLEQNLKSPLKLISAMFLGAFPLKYKKAVIKNQEFNHTDIADHKDYSLGFLNIPIVKHIFRRNAIKRCVVKNVDLQSTEVAFGYSMSTPIVDNLLYIKKRNKKVKTCLIVPDLPEFMNFSSKKRSINGFLSRINTKRLYKRIKDIDYFVVITKYLPEKLGVDANRCVVIEGIADFDYADSAPKEKPNVKNIVYTGSISPKYGIATLVDSFSALKDENLRLVLAGSGETECVENAQKTDNRIEFLGTVPNAAARELQRNAYLLVNPRNSDDEFTKYSFPSKTMEYMSSGTPVVTMPLKGIPEEYYEHLIIVENSLEETFKSALSLDAEELALKGKNAMEFVKREKNAFAQTKKIIELLGYEI